MKRELNRIADGEGFYLGTTRYTKTDMVTNIDKVCLNLETNELELLDNKTMVEPDMKQFTTPYEFPHAKEDA